MTGPNDDEARSSDTTETASSAKQQTPQQNEGGIVAEKALPLPARIQLDEQSQQFADKLHREEIYRTRLARFWAAAHQNFSSGESMDERKIFLQAMEEVREDLAILVAEGEVAILPTDVIMGNPQEIELEVAERMSANPEKSDLARFMRSSIASTIDHLEVSGEGTLEIRVDIVVRVLFELRGSASAAKLGCDLYRYLQAQTERNEGYYQTVFNLAVIVSGGGLGYVTETIFLYHSVLDGVRNLHGGQGSAAGGASGNEVSRNLVSAAAARLVRILARGVREMDSTARGRVLPVLHHLMKISAVTCSTPSFGEDSAPVIAVALGLSTTRPAESLAVLMDMAEMADAWAFDNIATSQLEASGAVGAAATGNVLRAVGLLYNAGISLRNQKEVTGVDDVLMRARMLINAAGLRLALDDREDLYGALVDLDGIDCAINFIANFVDYGPTGEADVVAGLRPLAIEVAHLSQWPMLQGVRRRTDIARLGRAATSLGITVDVRSTFPEFALSAQRAVEVLRSSLGFNKPRGVTGIVVDTADLVGSLYGSVLGSEDSEKLRSLVVDLAAKRDNAMLALFEEYAQYSSTTSDTVGLGPAVVALTITEAEWRSVAQRLMDHVNSVVRAIAEFVY